jgi:hypothetical protein
MMDVEDRNNRAAQAPVNPYTGPGPDLLPPNHLIHKLKRVIYMVISAFGLSHYDFFRALIVSPNIRHEWFKIGLACTIAILSIKAYVEMYQGKVQKKQVNYKNFRQTTHVLIFLILLATLAFNIALWPHYGWNSPVLLGICFFGLILQFLLIVPNSVQNLGGFAILTFFLQQYTGLSESY